MSQYQFYAVIGSKKEKHSLLEDTLKLLNKKVHIITLSSVFKGKEEGRNSDITYLNMCVFFRSQHASQKTKEILKKIENIINKNKKTKIIDIDLLFCIEQQSQIPKLPHPDLSKMLHLSLPMTNIAPNLCPYNTNVTMQDISISIKNTINIRPIEWVPIVK